MPITKKRILSKSSLKLLKYIAVNGESWQYRMHKEVKMNLATVNAAVKELLDSEMIIETHIEQRQEEHLKKFYYLTFRGMIEVLHYLQESNKKVRKEEPELIITNFNRFYNFPLFRQHESLREMYEENIYNLFIKTGWLTLEVPPPISLFPGMPMPLVQAFRSGKYGEVKRGWKYLSEDYLRYAFSFMFFTFTGCGLGFKPKPNDALLKHANETFQRSIRSWKEMLHRVQERQIRWQEMLSKNGTMSVN